MKLAILTKNVKDFDIRFFNTVENIYILLSQYLYKLYFNESIFEYIQDNKNTIDYNPKSGELKFDNNVYKIDCVDGHYITIS